MVAIPPAKTVTLAKGIESPIVKLSIDKYKGINKAAPPIPDALVIIDNKKIMIKQMVFWLSKGKRGRCLHYKFEH